MKLISSYSISQQIVPSLSTSFSYQESLKKDPERFMEINLRQDAFRRVLEFFIRCQNVFEIEISVTQQRISDELGISLRWVIEAIKQIKKIGLITVVTHYGSPLFKGRKVRRGSDGKYRQIWIRQRRNVYKVSDHLFEPSIGSKLSSLFPSLSEKVRNLPKYIAIAILFANTLASGLKKECQMEYCTSNTISLYKDNHSLSRSIYQSRELYISLNEGSHLLPSRQCDIQSRELSQEDNQSRGIPMDPKELSQKIAEMRKSLEPQRAAQRALKAKSAGELTELLKGRITVTLHLSAKGQFYLMRYCDGALLYGLENLAHHGTIDNQLNFRLFESACIEYSRRNEIEVEVDHYDNLLKQLGYMDAQPLCKKILLESPLAQKRIAAPEPKKVEPAAHYQPRRRVVKPSENSGQVAVDSFLQDSFKALADKLGYSGIVSNPPQNSTQSVDNE